MVSWKIFFGLVVTLAIQAFACREPSLGALDAEGNPNPSCVGNRPPKFVTQPVVVAVAGARYEYASLAKDPDGDPLAYALLTGPFGLSVNPISGQVHWDVPFGAVGRYAVSLLVADGKGGSSTRCFFLRVYPQNNRPPHITTTPTTTSYAGLKWSYPAVAVDPDRDSLRWTVGPLPAGMIFDPLEHKFKWTPKLGQAGSYRIGFRVEDGRGGADSQGFVLYVRAGNCANRPPRITTQPITLAKVGQPYVYQVEAIDPDGDRLFWLTRNLPKGMIFQNNLHKFVWTPTATQAGTYRIEVAVGDGKGARDFQAFCLRVMAGVEPNRPPQFTSRPDTVLREGLPWIYRVMATDPDKDRILGSVKGVPPSVRIDSGTYTFSWTPNYDDSGTYGPLELVAEDGKGGRTTQAFTLRVANVNRAPVILSEPDTLAEAGTEWSYDLDAFDSDQDSLMYQILSGPVGMDVQGNRLQWLSVTDVGGTFEVRVRVVDPFGAADTQSFLLFVEAAAQNSPPHFTSEPDTLVSEAENYAYQATAEDPDFDIVHFRLARGPAGLSVNPHGLTQWSPGYTDSGLYPVTIVADDGRGGLAEQNYVLRVTDKNRLPQLEFPSDTAFRAPGSWVADLVVTDPDGDPVQLALIEAPVGMTLVDNRLSWYAGLDQEGFHIIRIQAIDSKGGVDSMTFRVLVYVIYD